MELALSLGDSTKQPFPFLDNNSKMASSSSDINNLGFCMGLGEKQSEEKSAENGKLIHERFRVSSSSSDPPLQLDLLPFSPVPRSQRLSNPVRFPWLPNNFGNESSSFSEGTGKRLDMNNFPLSAAAAEEEDDAAARVSASPPNSATSSFRLDFGMIRTTGSGGKNKRCDEAETERSGSRPSDDDENGSTRKKLRLSKEQSAFLEESFKEHNTLNPKQKLALAKQLNLRPRQVEVWFQNRRARTKLKQTEVDCEYLKRCCETLTEENRRLQKELQDLRALKTSRPFYMQLPATTLTMCPSCERVATTTATAPPATTAAATTTAMATGLSLASSGSSGGKAQQAHQSS